MVRAEDSSFQGNHADAAIESNWQPVAAQWQIEITKARLIWGKVYIEW